MTLTSMPLSKCWTKNWKRITTDNTFVANGAKIISTDIRPIGESRAFILYVEIAATALTRDLCVKVNVYGEGQRFIDVGRQNLYCDGFAGYDTLVFRFYPDNGFSAKAIRLYTAGTG